MFASYIFGTSMVVLFSTAFTLSILVNEQGFTHVPIYEEDREHIIGYVMLQDLSAAHATQQSQTQLRALAKPMSFVAETVNCLTLLTTFLRQRRHIAIVSDEFTTRHVLTPKLRLWHRTNRGDR
jgi:CBS domain containing-hemolysin-like protein